MIERDQANELAKAVVEVAQHYDLGAFLGENAKKSLAIGNLVLVVGTIYIPKAFTLIKISRMMTAAQHAQTAPPPTPADIITPRGDNVQDLRPTQGPGGLVIG